MQEQAEVSRWAAELEALHERIGRFFHRTEPRERARRYLAALLSGVERKNGWQIAEHAGEAKPYGIQRLIASASWREDAVRDELRGYVREHLGAADAVLVLDETGFLKKGTKSAGVARQYSGTAGKVENCQVGVFLAYSTARGTAFLDRELYVPKGWVEDPVRCREAGIPEEVRFQTKPDLGSRMLERAFESGVVASWVLADEVYGRDPRLRAYLEDVEQPYVLAVAANQPLQAGEPGTVQERVSAEPDAGWQCVSAGAGEKGPRLYDWLSVELPGSDSAWQRWLLVRRSREDPTDLAYYLTFAPTLTTLEDLVQAAGRRWTIETAFEAAKQEAGLDEYEVRSWHGWYRHITLSLLAHAFLAATRASAEQAGAQKGDPSTRSWSR